MKNEATDFVENKPDSKKPGKNEAKKSSKNLALSPLGAPDCAGAPPIPFAFPGYTHEIDSRYGE